MVTKKQHYYPRTLIKHFANEDDKLYSYIRMANKIQYVNYKMFALKIIHMKIVQVLTTY